MLYILVDGIFSAVAALKISCTQLLYFCFSTILLTYSTNENCNFYNYHSLNLHVAPRNDLGIRLLQQLVQYWLPQFAQTRY